MAHCSANSATAGHSLPQSIRPLAKEAIRLPTSQRSWLVAARNRYANWTVCGRKRLSDYGSARSAREELRTMVVTHFEISTGLRAARESPYCDYGPAVADIVSIIEAAKPVSAKRGPYKKQAAYMIRTIANLDFRDTCQRHYRQPDRILSRAALCRRLGSIGHVRHVSGHLRFRLPQIMVRRPAAKKFKLRHYPDDPRISRNLRD
jgi:hypothetical protein